MSGIYFRSLGESLLRLFFKPFQRNLKKQKTTNYLYRALQFVKQSFFIVSLIFLVSIFSNKILVCDFIQFYPQNSPM